MPKAEAWVQVMSEPEDGKAYHIGETVTFDKSDEEACISVYGTVDGSKEIVLSYALLSNQTSLVISASEMWGGNDPLHMEVTLNALVRHKPDVIARTNFEVAAGTS